MRKGSLIVLAVLLLSCEEGRKVTGYRVRMMRSCEVGQTHRSATDFMGNSVTLQLHSARGPSINDDFPRDHSWIWWTKKIFEDRPYKQLLLDPDSEVKMGQIFDTLDQLQREKVVNEVILITPKQVADIRDETCKMD